MRLPVGVLCSALVFGATSVTIAAQPARSPGARVRLVTARGTCGDTAGTSAPCVGRLVRASGDSVVMDSVAGRERVAVALAQVRRLDLSVGHGDHRWLGATIGGALTAAAFNALAGSMSNGSCRVTAGNVGGFLAYAAVEAIPGVLVGGFVGSRFSGDERWRAVWPVR